MLRAMGVQDKDIITLADNSDAISTISTGRAGAFAATGLTVSELAKKSSKVELASGFIDPVIDGKPVRSWGALCLPKDLCAGI